MIKHQISKGRQLGNVSNQIHTLWNEVLRWCQLTHVSKFTKRLRKYIGLRNDQKSLRRKLVTIFPVPWRLEWWEAIQNQPIAKFLTTFALLDYQVSVRSECEDTASYGEHLGGPCARDKENGVFLNKTFLRGTSSDKCTSKLLKRFIKTIRDDSEDHLMSSGWLLEPKGLQPHITELKINIWNVGIMFWSTDNDMKVNTISTVEWTTYAVVNTDVKQLKIAQDISVFYV